MINIARCLHRLLQPIYDRVASSSSFSTGSDAIQALLDYQQQGYLQSTTLFATLHIQHSFTLFSHPQAVSILECFLHEHLPSKQSQGITIPTIIQFVRFLLDHQCFMYEKKFYRHIKGGGCGSPLMALLVNVILFDWQKEFVSLLKKKNEVFGRY